MSGIKQFFQYISGMAAAVVSVAGAAGLINYIYKLYTALGFALPAWVCAAVCLAAAILGTAAISGTENERDRVVFCIAMAAVSVLCMIGLRSPSVKPIVYVPVSVCAMLSVAAVAKKKDADWQLFFAGSLLSGLSLAGIAGAAVSFGSDRETAAYYTVMALAAFAAAVITLRSHVFVQLSSMLSVAAAALTARGLIGRSGQAAVHILISIGLSLAAMLILSAAQRTNPRASDIDWKALDLSEFLSGVQKVILIILALLLAGTLVFGGGGFEGAVRERLGDIAVSEGLM